MRLFVQGIGQCLAAFVQKARRCTLQAEKHPPAFPNQAETLRKTATLPSAARGHLRYDQWRKRLSVITGPQLGAEWYCSYVVIN